MHRDDCPTRSKVEDDARMDFEYYGRDYHRYYDGCHDAERIHRDEMTRQEEEHAAQRRADARRDEERRMEEEWHRQAEEEQDQREQEAEYWRQEEEKMRQLEADEAESKHPSDPGHDVR